MERWIRPDRVVLTRPVPMDEANRGSIRLVEGRVIGDQHAVRQVDERCDFPPEGGGIGNEAMQEAREGIVGGGVGAARLDAGCFDATDGTRGGDEEINVLGVGTAR